MDSVDVAPGSGLCGLEELRSMKKSAYLINLTAGTVKEDDLAKAFAGKMDRRCGTRHAAAAAPAS
jgi:phosphoglycerate dehydrogenase-like enzyme